MPGAYHDALALLAGTGPEYGESLTSTGHTVADALVTMGRSQAVVPWVQNYRSRLEPTPAPTRPITRNNWRQALGDVARVSDWIVFFRRELQQAPWMTVLQDWVPRLAPGLAGAAGHGLLRLACATRNIVIEELDLLKEELAAGLGYWAARFIKLPGIPASAIGGNLTPAEALPRIKWQHKKRPPQLPSITDGLRELSGFPPFAGVINLVRIPDEPVDLISQITEVMARILLSNSYDPGKVIPFIHALVVPAAVRHVIPQVEQGDAQILSRYGWQFAGAMYAIYGRANPVETCEPPDLDQDQLIDRAVGNGNEFAILFTAACIREYALYPQPAFLAAAQEAISKI